MSQHVGPPGAVPARGLVELISRPLRMYAPFMTAGAIMFAIGAIFLLAQSGAGVTTFAEGRAGAVMTIPATATSPLVIYAIPTIGPLQMDCSVGATSAALLGPNFGMSARHDGQTLKPRQDLASWRAGDTFTCTGTGFQRLVLGHNDGLTHLLQGLLAAAGAVGGGTLGLLGFAARRYQHRP